MSVQSVLSDITEDNVKSALQKAKHILNGNSTRDSAAYNILKTLNVLVYKINEGASCTSSATDIYQLATLACKSISAKWKSCKQLSFMQCLYHISRHLLKTHPEYSRNLSEFYFKLKDNLKIIMWNEQETLVLANTIHNFFNYLNEHIYEVQSDILIKFESSWMNFILRLMELNNFDHLERCFNRYINFLMKIREVYQHEAYIQFSAYCLNSFTDWFTYINDNNLEIVVMSKDLTAFYSLIDISMYFMNETELSGNGLKAALKCLKEFKKLTTKTPGLELLEKCLKLCISDDLTIGTHFKNLNSLISSHEIKDKEVYSPVSSILFKFRTKIAKNDQINQFLPDALHFILYLFRDNSKGYSSSSHRKVNDILNTFFIGLYLTFSVAINKDILIEVFDVLKHLIKQFASIPNLSSLKSSGLPFGVSAIVNVLITYKKAELYKETASLSKIMIKYILALSLNDALVIKNYAEYIISTMAFSYEKVRLGVEAQIALIAVAGVHKGYHEIVFKAWAELKNSNTTSNLDLETTALSIIQDYSQTLEKLWPPFNVEKVDIDLLLLSEIQAYSKIRSLHKEPVLAAYKIAANHVKDEFILAAILIGTVDSITTENNLPRINNFELSLNNLLKRLNQKELQEKEDPESFSVVNLIKGNILYQQGRCELLNLRKKTEDEVVLMDVKSHREIPILRADQGDELDECSIAPAFSFLKHDAQKFILDKMEAALSYWQICIDSLPQNVIAYSSLRYIKAVGYLYRLYNDKRKEIQSWKLLYKIADKLSSSKHKVIAIAEMLLVKKNVNSQAISKCKEILEKQDTGLNNKSYVYQIFYINLAKNAYYNGKFAESKEIIEGIDIALVKYNILVLVQYKVFKAMIYRKEPPGNDAFDEASLCPIVKVFENLLYLVKFNKWNSFNELCVLQWLLLDTATLLGSTYSDMKYVRQARCYTRSQFTVAQRLALPLRVCDLLSVLTWTDLHCWKVEDCNFKLKGLETILDLGVVDTIDPIEKPSSPGFAEKIRCAPHFLTHADDCNCRYCINLDYQIQVLNSVTLRAHALIANNPKEVVEPIFKIGHQIIEFLDSKSKEYEEYLCVLDEHKIRFYMIISIAHTIWGKYDIAMKYNLTSQETMKNSNLCNTLLNLYLLEQQQCIHWTRNYCRITVSTSKPNKRRKEIPIDIKTTPEQNKTELPALLVTPPNENTKELITPRPFHRRKLDLDIHTLSDEECEKNSMSKLPLPFPDEEKDVHIFKNKNVQPLEKQLTKLKSNEIKPLETPSMKSRTFFKAQSEKKLVESKAEVDFYTATCIKKPRSKKQIEIYCDDEDTPVKNKTGKKITKKKQGRAGQSKLKKPEKQLLFCDDPEIVEIESSKKRGVRKFIFDETVSCNSDDDNDIQFVKEYKKNEQHQTKNTSSNTEVDNSCSDMHSNGLKEKPGHSKQLPLDDSWFIEMTPPSTTKNAAKLDLTPHILGQQLSQLALSSKKATATPHSTQISPEKNIHLTKSISRTYGRSGLRSKKS